MAATAECDNPDCDNSENTEGLTHDLIKPISQSNAVQIVTTRKYSLNINKTLRKKLQGCEEVNVDYDVTDGGVKGKMDTATFELFRLSCTSFFKEFPEHYGRCVIDFSEDKRRRAVVQQTYKVRREGHEKGYTLNLYPTNNALLLNGKFFGWFIEEHLPLIHQIMVTAVQDRDVGSVENFNHILSCQLQKVLDERQSNNPGSLAPVPSPQYSVSPPKDQQLPIPHPEGLVRDSNDKVAHDIAPQNEICPKCTRKMKSRGAFCEAGSHWVHYFCDRLTEEEIKRLHTDPGYIYKCKQCSTSDDNTMVKTVAPAGAEKIQNGQICEARTVLELPYLSKKASGEPEGMSAAEAILEEEMTDTCHVCELQLAGNINRCDLCASPCHDGCMAHAAGMEEVCLSCAATQAQISQATGIPDVSSEVIQLEDSQMNPTEAAYTENNQNEYEPLEPHNVQEENRPQRVVQEPDASQLSQEPKSTQQPAVKTTKPREKKNTSESLSVKQGELRQLEIKLKSGKKTLRCRMLRWLTLRPAQESSKTTLSGPRPAMLS